MPISSLVEKVRAAKRVYVVGNGGSFSNAEHLVNDLLSVGVKAYSINHAFFSATANDKGYYQSFARWIRVVGEPDDLLIALSGSGKSPNILIACEAAEEIGMEVHREFGAELGQDAQVSEQHQLIVAHEIMRALRK